MGAADRLGAIFARQVARQPESRLEALMRSPARRPLLRSIFTTVPRMLDRRAAEGVEMLLELRIRHRPERHDRWQIRIADGRCRTSRRELGEPTVSVEMDGVTFLKMASGAASGPVLFLSGEIEMEGNGAHAMLFPSLFRIPASPSGSAG